MADTKEILLRKICKAEREAAISGDNFVEKKFKKVSKGG